MPKWEYKFVFKDDRMANGFFDVITRLKELAGYSCQYIAEQDVTNIDYYFDSPDLKLESQGMVCRTRCSKKDGEFNLVLKRQAEGQNRETVYLQTDPIPLGTGGLEELINGNFPPNIYRVLVMFAGSSELEHVLSLKVKRKVVKIADHFRIVATMNLDEIKVLFPGSDAVVAKGYEIEIKSDSDDFPEADVLRDYLCNAFGMIPITRSKLGRMGRLILHHMEGMPRKIILDMDTGVDDALALLLAMQTPELNVLGVTVVGGNVNVHQSARNTAAVMSHLRPYINDRYPNLLPIVAGADLKQGTADASDVHGPDGLGGACDKYLNHSIEGEIRHNEAVAWFKETVRSHPPGAITLITTGPMTNTALWTQKCPDEVCRLKEIISMGGVFFQAGNRSQIAEFNIHSDPESARKVVEFCRAPKSSGPHEWHETLPLTFVGMDVTHQVRFRRERLKTAMAKKPDDPKLCFVRDITGGYMNFYYRNEGLDGCYLHDPLAVAYAVDPSLCQAEQYHVEVEDQGEFTSGTTVCDYRPTRLFKDKMKEVTWVCYKVDSERFEDFFFKKVLG